MTGDWSVEFGFCARAVSEIAAFFERTLHEHMTVKC
jgi:hypothetical protein